MKEVFRSSSPARVALCQSVLESAGLCTFVRNGSTQQSLVLDLLTAVLPIPDFWPTLCVMNDHDYPEAMTILRSVKDPLPLHLEDWKCARCGECVPGNFTACWSCENPRDENEPPHSQ